jgi:hypothetical protein
MSLEPILMILRNFWSPVPIYHFIKLKLKAEGVESPPLPQGPLMASWCQTAKIIIY